MFQQSHSGHRSELLTVVPVAPDGRVLPTKQRIHDIGSTAKHKHSSVQRTASCFNLFPRVVRICVSLARRLRYWAARLSFSSRVRSSSRCKRWIGSSPSRSSWSDVPFETGGGECILSLSKDCRLRAPLVVGLDIAV